MKGPTAGPGHSSSQSMHAQATAQMAILMDHQRRDIRDPYNKQSEDQGNGDQASAMARLRMDQRALLQERQNQQLRQQPPEDNAQKSHMQARQQQTLGERRRGQTSPYSEGFDDYRNSSHSSGRLDSSGGLYDRGIADDDRSSTGQMSDRDGREEFDEPQRAYDQRFRGSQGSLNGDIGPMNDFRFHGEKGQDFAPPPIMGTMRKQQVREHHCIFWCYYFFLFTFFYYQFESILSIHFKKPKLIVVFTK